MTLALTLMRHGEPSQTNCLLGRTDLALSANGRRQMRLTSQSLKLIDRVITSPLSRCQAFASEFAQKKQLKYEVDPAWRECDFGEWDGLSYQQLNENHTTDFENFIQQPNRYFPIGGEGLASFSERIESALKKLVKDYPDEKILLVTHSGVIRMIVAWCLKMDRLSSDPFQRFKIDYASLTQIDIYSGEPIFPQLKSLNNCQYNEENTHD